MTALLASRVFRVSPDRPPAPLLVKVGGALSSFWGGGWGFSVNLIFSVIEIFVSRKSAFPSISFVNQAPHLYKEGGWGAVRRVIFPRTLGHF